ncbi:MAG: hypothetical protein OEN56_08430 [Gemmatimonadota bacterium]|nr:hypothetical protein [Gemmatimonadota bacterium]
MRTAHTLCPNIVTTLALAGILVSGGIDGVSAQSPDPDAVLEEARKAQRDFEQYRRDHTPVKRGARPDGVCDERIGRICIWFGGEDEESFPVELDEVKEARVALIRRLFDALEDAPDRWVIGQLVHYLVENRNFGEAERVADECGIDETWWCSALLGYALHLRTEYVEAESAFMDAFDGMPESEREEWMTALYIFPRNDAEEFDELPADERDRLWRLYWRLSDPLFLFEGNDRFTDHYARWVVAMNRRDSADPLGLEWEEDLEETLIRYGRNIGYSRTHDPSRMMSNGFVDTRRMVGHHHPKSRGYLFPEEFLESPSDIPPESWITAPREARTWHAPLYAPEINGLETQVGRFRRDDAMLVVGAYRPTMAAEDRRASTVPVWGNDESAEEPPYAALFLVPEDGGPLINVQGRDPEGVLTLETRPGRYVSSLEVVDLPNRRAWRARQGVVQKPLVPGLVGVSDLMILKEGAPFPESLDDALPYVRPGVRVRPGERFGVLWEVYGLRIDEPVRVTIGYSEGLPDFLSDPDEFLETIESDENIDITFEDTGPDRVQAIFRSVEIELRDVEPGEYTLHLRLELAGRTPVVTSRPLIVEG